MDKRISNEKDEGEIFIVKNKIQFHQKFHFSFILAKKKRKRMKFKTLNFIWSDFTSWWSTDFQIFRPVIALYSKLENFTKSVIPYKREK